MRRALALAALLLAATGAGAEPRFHEVTAGESLASIAGAELGNQDLWPVLYRANRDRIKDPARIYPGQRIAIPSPDEAPTEPLAPATVTRCGVTISCAWRSEADQQEAQPGHHTDGQHHHELTAHPGAELGLDLELLAGIGRLHLLHGQVVAPHDQEAEDLLRQVAVALDVRHVRRRA